MSHSRPQNLLETYGYVNLPPADEQRHPSPKHHKHHASALWFRIVRAVFFILLIALCVGLIIIGFNLKHLSAVVSNFSDGKENLESSLLAAQGSDFDKAGELAEAAVKDFKAAGTELDALRLGPLAYVPIIKNYRAEAGHLAKGGEELAEGMNRSLSFAYGFKDIVGAHAKTSFSKLPTEEKRRLLSSIYNADGPLEGMGASLDAALAEFSQVKSFAWLQPVAGRIEEMKTKISSGRETLNEAAPLTRLLPPLLGYPNSAEFLFILQNSDELRPTGGFIGTYGIISAKDGDFTRFETHDIYHLDMPVQSKIRVEPPDPIKTYLNKQWYMRDANWSPDWPTAAEKILWFYRQENAAQPKPDPLQDFDGVIAVTPELITELMKLTGPLTVEGQTYNSENFIDLLQYRVEQGYVKLGESSWQRKEVIGEISKQLKEKLLDLPLERWPEMIRLLGNNMARKNILLYSRDPALQKLIRDQGWSGEIRHQWGDYLMVVDANLAALKTDAVMEREINYRLEQQPSGELKAVVTLHYSHNGNLDWKTSRYQSYTRIYVPEGSRLLTMRGEAPGSASSGNEAGRSWFGGYITVAPRKMAELSFEYILPRQLADNMKQYNNYSLLIQKQPGSQNTKLTVDANFNNAIKSYNPINLSTDAADGRRFKATGTLSIDRSFLINF